MNKEKIREKILELQGLIYDFDMGEDLIVSSFFDFTKPGKDGTESIEVRISWRPETPAEKEARGNMERKLKEIKFP